MRARISDPQGPKAWRIVPYVLPILALLFAVFGPIRGVPATMTALSAVMLFNILSLVSWRQRRPRPADALPASLWLEKR